MCDLSFGPGRDARADGAFFFTQAVQRGRVCNCEEALAFIRATKNDAVLWAFAAMYHRVGFDSAAIRLRIELNLFCRLGGRCHRLLGTRPGR